MNTLYWFNVLNGFAEISCILVILLIIGLCVLLGTYIIHYIVEGKDDKTTVFIKKMLWKLFIPFCITTMAAIFIPSKEDMYIIYGVGGTLDYLKENPEAGKLPDKTIELLNVAMDEYINDHKNEKTEE